MSNIYLINKVNKGGYISMSWLIRLIKGVIIALGFILPGVSGGVLAAILGLYERMLGFLAHIRENFKANFLYFLPVGIGGARTVIPHTMTIEVETENLEQVREALQA